MSKNKLKKILKGKTLWRSFRVFKRLCVSGGRWVCENTDMSKNWFRRGPDQSFRVNFLRHELHFNTDFHILLYFLTLMTFLWTLKTMNYSLIYVVIQKLLGKYLVPSVIMKDDVKNNEKNSSATENYIRKWYHSIALPLCFVLYLL
jgi:hypothetical protein